MTRPALSEPWEWYPPMGKHGREDPAVRARIGDGVCVSVEAWRGNLMIEDGRALAFAIPLDVVRAVLAFHDNP